MQLTRVRPAGLGAHLSSNRQDHAIMSFVRANRDIIIFNSSSSSPAADSRRLGITIDILLHVHRSEFEPSTTLLRDSAGECSSVYLNFDDMGTRNLAIANKVTTR